MELFEQRYCRSGTPLASVGRSGRNPDFSDWQVWIDPGMIVDAHLQHLILKRKYSADVLEVENAGLICCPEDQDCRMGCKKRKGALQPLPGASVSRVQVTFRKN